MFVRMCHAQECAIKVNYIRANYVYLVYIIVLKNEQKVGMLLQKKNKYKRSRDK